MYATLTLPAGHGPRGPAPRRRPCGCGRRMTCATRCARRAGRRSRWMPRAWTGCCTRTPRAGCSKSRRRPPGANWPGTLPGAASRSIPSPASRACRPRSAKRSRRPARARTACPCRPMSSRSTLVTPDGELRRADRHANRAAARARARRPGRARRALQPDPVDRIAPAQRRATPRPRSSLHAGGRRGERLPPAPSNACCRPRNWTGSCRTSASLVDERRLALLGISVRRYPCRAQLPSELGDAGVGRRRDPLRHQDHARRQRGCGGGAPRPARCRAGARRLVPGRRPARRHARAAGSLLSDAQGLPRGKAPRRSRRAAAERVVPAGQREIARRNPATCAGRAARSGLPLSGAKAPRFRTGTRLPRATATRSARPAAARRAARARRRPARRRSSAPSFS